MLSHSHALTLSFPMTSLLAVWPWCAMCPPKPLSNKPCFFRVPWWCCWGASCSHNKNHKGWCSHNIGSGQGNIYGGLPEVVRALLSAPRLFFFFPHCKAFRILVPWPGIKPVSPEVEAQSPNHWTTREFSPRHFWIITTLSIGWYLCKIGIETILGRENKHKTV